MNIKDLHTTNNPVSAASLFKNNAGSATSIQIQKGEKLKEHTSKTHALLLCHSGSAIFENENGVKLHMESGDYVPIEPMVVHWILATTFCELVLIK